MGAVTAVSGATSKSKVKTKRVWSKTNVEMENCDARGA